MRTNKLSVFLILLIITLPFTYGDCFVVFSSGDLDRDKEKGGDDSSGSFIGITSQATITSANLNILISGLLWISRCNKQPISLAV